MLVGRITGQHNLKMYQFQQKELELYRKLPMVTYAGLMQALGILYCFYQYISVTEK